MTIASTKNKLLLTLFVSFNFTVFSQTVENYGELDTILKNTTGYEFDTVDFDLDGRQDIYFWNRYLQGDSLFIVRNTEAGYVYSLRTLNFSEDGLFKVDSIQPAVENEKDFLAIYTHFNGSGGLQKTIFLQYTVAKHQWKISHILEESVEGTEEGEIYLTMCRFELNKKLPSTNSKERLPLTLDSKKKDCKSTRQE
jgi:hypothetical protein